MKTKKSVLLLLSLVFLSFLPFGHGIEPGDIINSYLGAYKNAGNVLSYRNAYNEIITIKSGIFHDLRSFHTPGQQGYRSLDLVVLTVASDRLDDYFNANGTPKRDSYFFSLSNLREREVRENLIRNFSIKCSESNDDWNALAPRQGNIGDDLQTRLGQYRHTELQIQALYKSYLESFDEDHRLGRREPCLKTKVLKNLLPVALTEPASRTVADKNIYSLFEACRACMRTSWLANPATVHKERFLFAILDNQYLGDGHKRQVIPEGSFFLQSTLETTAIPAPDLEDIEGTIGEFSKQIDKLYIKIREGFRGISHNFRDLN